MDDDILVAAAVCDNFNTATISKAEKKDGV